MRRLIQVTMFTAAMSLSSLALGQSFEAGIKAYIRDDYATAIENFRPLAERGIVKAQYFLGVMYDNGEGVLQDYNKAFQWYRRAAEQGDIAAQHFLGMMYEQGEGVPKDDNEAVQWYRRAAEQGYASAQYNLGNMLSNGREVTQNYSEAAQWLRRGAEQGHANSQLNLGVMYAKGQGVTRDLVITYFLSNLSAAQGNEMARENRDLVLEGLNQDQIAEGQRLASEWQVGMPLPSTKDTKTWP